MSQTMVLPGPVATSAPMSPVRLVAGSGVSPSVTSSDTVTAGVSAATSYVICTSFVPGC